MTVQKPDEEAIFNIARKISAVDARQDYLRQVCGGDTALLNRVQALLQVQDEDKRFLADPAPALGAMADAQITERPGTVIGAYKLLEPIGEGGFGIVFMAEQHHPVRRKVALKVVKPGMDTRQVVARFEVERQALALMDHPNIAQVFDGGETVAGRPYFVMELVRGVPITDFCDRNHVSVRQRLDLFVSVCQAVQHAHQKGIIHRDLKPSNVLVTLHDDKPVVKVIDFGIAKATGQQLTEKTLFTNFAQMIGTPLYMSPEQAQMSGLDVDTRSDIYSLGVLLYELLTGTTPFDQERLRTAAYDEVCRIIREEEPPKPSTRLSTLGQAVATVSANRGSDPQRLRQLCRGELDWIVMKALEKDRNRRYETVNGLARDVLRYLQDEPVQACPPSWRYRLGKLARRHKAGLWTAALLLTALVLGTAVSAWQAVQATIAKNAATEARIAESDAKQRAQELADKATKDLEQLNAANRSIENGRVCVDLRDWAKAESEFSKAVGCAPNSSHVWAERAEFYSRLGLWDLAAADSAKAFERREPGFAHYYLHLALLRFYIDDTNGYRQTCKDAEQRFAGTTEQGTCQSLISAYLVSADPVVDSRRLRQLAETAIQGSNHPWRPDYLGMILYRAEDYQKALERLLEAQAQARAMNPEWEPARIHATLAMIYHRLDRPDLARKELDAASKSLDQRIQTMLETNQPGSLPTYWWVILIGELRFREAKKVIEGEPPPPDPKLLVIRGRTLAAIGRQAEAAASFSKAIELKPKMLEAWTGRAAVRSRLAEWGKAKADYKQAIALAPKDANAHNNLAWLLATCPEVKLLD
ncbi:MAG TPA: protein kinase, partial [Gemmataceae bacterium]|nr:protein kinase [Gemmataceae bacterium]